MGKLDGKVALITGGARGQGRSHALALADEGCDIAFCDISEPVKTTLYRTATEEDRLETQKLVSEAGRRCLAVEADVRDRPAMKAFVARTSTSWVPSTSCWPTQGSRRLPQHGRRPMSCGTRPSTSA